MAKKVKFSSSLSGTIQYLSVWIQEKRVSTAGRKVSYEKQSDGSELNVIYKVSGLNGTAFVITYSCTSDGVAKKDPDQGGPDIQGSIEQDGVALITLKIAL